VERLLQRVTLLCHAFVKLELGLSVPHINSIVFYSTRCSVVVSIKVFGNSVVFRVNDVETFRYSFDNGCDLSWC